MYIAAPIEGKALLEIEKIRDAIAEFFGDSWLPNKAPLHITFEHMPADQDPIAVIEVAKNVAAINVSTTDVKVTILAQWRPHKKESLLVLLVNKQTELAYIADQIRQQLQDRQIIVDGDRPFKPHITLGRFKSRVEGVSEFIQSRQIIDITFTVDRLKVYGALNEPHFKFLL